MINDPSIRFGVVRGISYGLFGPPDAFVAPARALGAGLLRAYIYWGQVEPKPGQFVWDVVDALLAQLDGDEEVWITVSSSSPWATVRPTDFLPPSPAHDLAAYGAFVRRLVSHCKGRVHYWQCDNEPSNVGLTWAGTAAEYVAQLTELYRAVKEVAPAAAVVLGGCGYDVFSSEEGSASRTFFEYLVSAGRDAYDLFDAHFYGDPMRIPEFVATAERLMRAGGAVKPIVAGEYGGPILFEFPELEPVLQQTLTAAFAAPPGNLDTAELKAQLAAETPERRALAALYRRMAELPPRLQMFMDGCPPELEAKRHRIACRQVVMRNLLLLAAGVRRTLCWNLAPEVPSFSDPYQMMQLLFGKLALMDFEGRELVRRRPAGDTFARFVGHMAGSQRVTRLDLAGRPSVHAFEVERAGRAPLLVLWDQRDTFDGEDQPPVAVTVPYRAAGASAVDALGQPHDVRIGDGTLGLDLSVTPVLITLRP